MSKLADQLRAIEVYNNYGLLMRFGGPKDVAVEYFPYEGHIMQGSKTTIGSPHFKTSFEVSYHSNRRKSFYGNRAVSMPLALEWASKEYGITEWVPSPFGGKVPKSVMEKARAALKEASE